jgi:hypothetical protein
MAHELAHVLQGCNRHSEEGLMKAHGVLADYMEMEVHPLSLTVADVERI